MYICNVYVGETFIGCVFICRKQGKGRRRNPPQKGLWVPGPLWAGFLWALLCPCGSGPCGPPLALVGWAHAGPPRSLWARPLWPPWALWARTLWASLALCAPGPFDPPGPFWAGPLWAPLGPRGLVGPLRAPLGPCGPGPCGPTWALVGRPLRAPWALMGRVEHIYIYVYVQRRPSFIFLSTA